VYSTTVHFLEVCRISSLKLYPIRALFGWYMLQLDNKRRILTAPSISNTFRVSLYLLRATRDPERLWPIRSATPFMPKQHFRRMKWHKSKDIIFFLGLFPFGFILAFACPAGGVFRPLTTFLGLGARFSRGLLPGVLTFPWIKKQKYLHWRIRKQQNREERYVNFC